MRRNESIGVYSFLKCLMPISLTYHQKTCELLGITPITSRECNESITAFESRYNVRLPTALREWYALSNNHSLLEQISIPHYAVELVDVPRIQQEYVAQFSISGPFPVLVENQRVWHMAVKLHEGENPPVYLRYNEVGEIWKLQARSFSDWLYALAWDYLTVKQNWGWLFLTNSEEQASAHLSGFEVIGPETFIVNAQFRGSRFLRVMNHGERLTVVFPENDALFL